MKLTAHQIKVLQRMNAGDEVWTVSGPYASTFWHTNICSNLRPRFDTMRALWKRGLVESYDNHNGNKYRITPAGRAALDQASSKDEAQCGKYD